MQVRLCTVLPPATDCPIVLGQRRHPHIGRRLELEYLGTRPSDFEPRLILGGDNPAVGTKFELLIAEVHMAQGLVALRGTLFSAGAVAEASVVVSALPDGTWTIAPRQLDLA